MKAKRKDYKKVLIPLMMPLTLLSSVQGEGFASGWSDWATTDEADIYGANQKSRTEYRYRDVESWSLCNGTYTEQEAKETANTNWGSNSLVDSTEKYDPYNCKGSCASYNCTGYSSSCDGYSDYCTGYTESCAGYSSDCTGYSASCDGYSSFCDGYSYYVFCSSYSPYCIEYAYVGSKTCQIYGTICSGYSSVGPSCTGCNVVILNGCILDINVGSFTGFSFATVSFTLFTFDKYNLTADVGNVLVLSNVKYI